MIRDTGDVETETAIKRATIYMYKIFPLNLFRYCDPELQALFGSRISFTDSTLSGLKIPLSSSSITSRELANCCRNSRLVVDEDDLKWVINEKKYCYYSNSTLIVSFQNI